MPTESKNTVLDQVKQIEKRNKARLLIKTLTQLKKFARDIYIMKEKTNLLLDNIGVSEKDSKAIIDFINSLPEVQLSEENKKDLKEDIKEEIVDKRKEIEREVEKDPMLQYMNLSSPMYKTSTGYTNANVLTSAIGIVDTSLTGTKLANDQITFTNGSNKLNVSL